MLRLHKFIADAGVASRREAERLILCGRVQVNGSVVYQLGSRVDANCDRVEVNGVPIKAGEPRLYIVLNKPKGMLSTVADPHGRSHVRGLLKGVNARVYPVGRLDADAEGLLLMTNDGRMADRLAHPRYEVWRTYLVTVEGKVGLRHLSKVRAGVALEEGPALPARVGVVRSDGETTTLRLSLREGRNRQIKRMMAALGLRLLNLKRISFGPLRLGALRPGMFRPLTVEEHRRLDRVVNRDGRKA